MLFGSGKNAASRMTSLLPDPLGSGTRKNKLKRQYVLEHLRDLDYCTLACGSEQEAREKEAVVKAGPEKYLFRT